MKPKLTAIPTTSDLLPRRCPAGYCAALTVTRESGAITRLSCPKCHWIERYLIVETS